MSGARAFVPEVRYTKEGWFAQVRVPGARDPYWTGSRFTRVGAQWAAKRKARQLSRLDAKGMLAS